MSYSIGIAVSTINDGIFRIAEICRSKADVVYVLHQITETTKENEYRTLHHQLANKNVIIHTMHAKGLAKSRNVCIKKINTKYAIVCDDDIVPDTLLYEQILDYAKQYPDTAVFTGRIKNDENNYKKEYAQHMFEHTIRSAAQVSSCEMIINTEWIKTNNIFFDERFGLGAEFPSGEEFIFLTDIIKKSGIVRYVPVDVCTHAHDTSGYTFTKEMLIAKGAMIRRVYGWQFAIIHFVFAIKKYNSYRNQFTFLLCIYLLFQGSKQFIQNG